MKKKSKHNIFMEELRKIFFDPKNHGKLLKNMFVPT